MVKWTDSNKNKVSDRHVPGAPNISKMRCSARPTAKSCTPCVSCGAYLVNLYLNWFSSYDL